MSKQTELLDLIGRYVNGLTAPDIQSKLPLGWFVTADHRKEVSNALQILKRKGAVRPVEDEDRGGIYLWVRVTGAEDTQDDDPDFSEEGEAVGDGSGEPLPELQAQSLCPGAEPLPVGLGEEDDEITLVHVPVYRTVYGTEHASLGEARRAVEEAKMLRRIEEFIAACGSRLPADISGDIPAVVIEWERWRLWGSVHG